MECAFLHNKIPKSNQKIVKTQAMQKEGLKEYPFNKKGSF